MGGSRISETKEETTFVKADATLPNGSVTGSYSAVARVSRN